jgi:hypothetical protein
MPQAFSLKCFKHKKVEKYETTKKNLTQQNQWLE